MYTFKKAFLFCFGFLPAFLAAQCTPIWHEILENRQEIPFYEFPPNTDTSLTFFLACDFGEATLIDPEVIVPNLFFPVEQIDLVYSNFPVNDTSMQNQLNRKRLNNFVALAPRYLSRPAVKWNLVSQTACKNEAEARELLHGFVITVNFDSWAAYAQGNINYIKEVLKGDFENAATDSIMFKVMRRNPDWDKMLVVQDVTASMFPYTAEILLWHKLNWELDKIRHYVFFNDGNMKPDAKKQVGHAGGVYHAEGTTLKHVMQVCFKTMKKGHGGDIQENNVEALVRGIANCEDYEEVIMIADNQANPRDMEWTFKVSKPVRVLVCGAYQGVNPVYLDLARETGGSVHTVEEDITQLMELQEGETLLLSGVSYVIRNGKFERVNSI